MRQNKITQSRLKELLNYDLDTGIFTWTKTRWRAIAGEVAGYKTIYGYIKIRIDGHLYQAHRLAWIYINGTDVDGFIDHKNRIRDDNRIDNLRVSSREENNRNRKSHSNNSTGFKGVYFNKATNSYRAQTTINGKRIHLGLFKTPELASMAYKQFASNNYGEFIFNNTYQDGKAIRAEVAE